jgi:hypothetical protein
MNGKISLRLAAISGLAVSAALAVWWLGSARLAIDRGADAGRVSAEALQLAWLVRALLVAVLGVRVGALRGGRAGAATAVGIVAPSWPVIALAWSASTVSLSQLMLSEALLLAGAIALPLIAQGLRRVLARAEVVEPIATGLAVVLAAAVWLAHDRWPFPLGL